MMAHIMYYFVTGLNAVSLCGYVVCSGMAGRLWNAPLLIISLASVVHSVVAVYFANECSKRRRHQIHNRQIAPSFLPTASNGVRCVWCGGGGKGVGGGGVPRSLEFLRVSVVVVGLVTFSLVVVVLVDCLRGLGRWEAEWERTGREMMENCISEKPQISQSLMECPFEVGAEQSVQLLKHQIWQAAITSLGIHGISNFFLLLMTIVLAVMLGGRGGRKMSIQPGCVGVGVVRPSTPNHESVAFISTTNSISLSTSSASEDDIVIKY